MMESEAESKILHLLDVISVEVAANRNETSELRSETSGLRSKRREYVLSSRRFAKKCEPGLIASSGDSEAWKYGLKTWKPSYEIFEANSNAESPHSNARISVILSEAHERTRSRRTPQDFVFAQEPDRDVGHFLSSAIRVSCLRGAENGSVPKVFSRRTLGEFEDASASIPLRQLDRAFQGADLRLGQDPGGPDGARRIQFRRYVASVDQRDSQQLDRLGDVLGALIGEVAASKQDFLVKAAERDGFIFADGVFRPAGTAPSSFAVTRVGDLAFIDDHGRRLHLLANESPTEAIGGAKELVESVCRTILRLIGESAPGKTADLVDIVNCTLEALEVVPAGIEQVGAVVARLGKLRRGHLPRHARLAVGAAVTFAGFVAETYVERAALKNG